MKLILLPACTLAILSALLSSCKTPEEVQKEQDERNKSYSDYQQKRAIRQQARQERTDMWYDRAMGKGPSVDTGLKLPGDP